MNISWKLYSLKLSHPFTISRNTETIRNNFYLKIPFENWNGFGESSPHLYYNETEENVRKCLNIFDILQELTSENIFEFIEELPFLFPANPSLISAVDMALYDILAQRENVPLYEYIGFPVPLNKITSFTIGIDFLNVIKRKIYLAENFPILKIKLGTSQDYDIFKIIQDVNNKKIRIDVNEGWGREEALKKLDWLNQKTESIEFIEQPLPTTDLEGIEILRKNTDIPIIADEAVRNSKDIDTIKDVYDGINIKLSKCGGITEAKKMITIAKEYDLKIMLGCFIESSLSISAAVHLSGLADYLDLDGNLLISNDPCVGVIVKNGSINLPDRPGIGVIFRDVFFGDDE